MRRLPHALAVLVVAALTFAPAAHANAFEDIFVAYQKTGKVDPCAFSAEELRKAKRQVPNDIEQYAPDFPAALDAAAEARASGACKKKAKRGDDDGAAAGAPGTSDGGTPQTAAPQTGGQPSEAPAAAPSADAGAQAATTPTPQPAPDAQPAPAVADRAIPAAAASRAADRSAGDAPAPLLLLALLGAVLALSALLLAAVRWWAFDPPWLARWRHATSEAGWRTSNAWAEFTDWVRLGR